MPFVIQDTMTSINKKTGKEFTMISYFRENTGIFNHMETDWRKGKQYDTATEAHREKRKYFAHSRVKVVNIEKLKA